ncbi:riboflavin kinase [Bacillus methanolicus]|uniref:riboflavin kinase n=1 Tax=Bacillus methanolicus TaxID=1471 RepID=UPI0023807823|nr:riboflavin kinase [Bacillus methanolicus]
MQQAMVIQAVKEHISICGRVVHGRKKGREIGFPTANVDADAGQLENGVYGVSVSLKGDLYKGIMNIGVKPTFESNLEKTIEVHLLDFQNDIYGELMECQLLFKVRDERKFPSIEFLKNQIKEDIRYAKQKFKSMGSFYQNSKKEFFRKEQIS